MSIENELYGIREIIGGLRADVSNLRQGVNENRELMATEIATIKKDLQEIKENRASIKGGWWALTALLGTASAIGGGVIWLVKTIGSSSNP